MRVLFCAYNTISMPGGGVRRIALVSKENLERIGVDVVLHNYWERVPWQEIDLVHVYVSDMRNLALFRRLPADVPLVVTPTIDTSHSPGRVRLFNRIARRLPMPIATSYLSHQLAFERAAAICAMSPHERTMLEQGFGVDPSRIVDMPNGVDTRYVDATPDAFMAETGLRDFCLYVGEIGSPRKNLLRLLDVAESMPDTQFVLAGRATPNDLAQRTITRAEALPNARYIGPLTDEQLMGAYAACKALALPSLIEETGLVGLEAALAGANAIVTKNGGTPLYYGDHAWYVDPYDTDSIREGIRAAMAAPNASRLREHILREFSPEALARRVADVYRRVVAGASPRDD